MVLLHQGAELTPISYWLAAIRYTDAASVHVHVDTEGAEASDEAGRTVDPYGLSVGDDLIFAHD